MDGNSRGGPGQYGTNNGGFPTTTDHGDNPSPEELMRMIMGGDDHDFPQMTHESPLMDDRSGDGFGGLRGGGGGGVGGYHFARGGPESGRVSNSTMPRMLNAATQGMSPPRGSRNDNVELSAMGGGAVSGIPPGVAVGTLYDAANHPHSPAVAHHYAAAAAATASSSPVAHSMAGLYYQDRRGAATATAAGATTPTRNDDRSSSSLMGHHHHHQQQQQQEARSTMVNQEASRRPDNFPRPQPGAPRGSTVRPAEPSLPRTRLGRRILTTKPQRQPDLVVAKFDQATTTPSSSRRLLDCTDVECATCSNSLQIPKSAVVVLCPICDQVNPVASCRVK